jgi:6-phosphogluconolactonase
MRAGTIRSWAASLLAAWLAVATPLQAGPVLHAYVGTNTPSRPTPAGETRLPSTNDLSHGRGIYLIDVDAATGAMSNLRLAAATRSPTWLVVDRSHGTLYAANEGGDGTVSAFRMDAVSGALAVLNVRPSKGSPVSLTIDASGRYVLAANYGGGSIAVFPIQPDGSLGEASDIVPAISDRTPARAPSAFEHVDDYPSAFHMVGSDHGGRFIFANDAMQDRIFVWRLSGTGGKLLPNDPPFFDVARGRFPRHFVFSPDDRFFFNLNERSQAIDVSAMSIVDGNVRLRPIGSAPTLPATYDGRNATSELLITRDGRYLYAANRGHETIAMFRASGDGRLVALGEVPAEASHPRSMTFDPTERYLFSLNQRGDQVAAFRIDRKSGRLNYTGHSLLVPSPSAMVFAPVTP